MDTSPYAQGSALHREGIQEVLDETVTSSPRIPLVSASPQLAQFRTMKPIGRRIDIPQCTSSARLIPNALPTLKNILTAPLTDIWHRESPSQAAI